MKNLGSQISDQLNQALTLMKKPALFSFTDDEKDDFLAEVLRLKENLQNLKGTVLVIGIIGGTGVGKSTLMNSLAGEPISSASHRRPHTEQALIYRHEDLAQMPEFGLDDLPFREITHRADDIRQIVLCDLPDYDSLMGEHRERVLEFLKHLDLLVWVTSPEKYADKAGYDFFDLLPKAKENFYFVLNKVDIFINQDTQGIQKSLEINYTELGKVTESFSNLIREHGVDDPSLFVISALDALNKISNGSWNQFSSFKKQIFKERDIKQIRAIKSANLDLEMKRLFMKLEKEISNLKEFARILGQVSSKVKEEHSAWIKIGSQGTDLWLNNFIKKEILFEHWDSSKLLGPGYLVGLLFHGWSRRFEGENNIADLSKLSFPEDILAIYKRQFARLDDRVNLHLLQNSLPPSLGDEVKDVLRLDSILDDIKEESIRAVMTKAAEPPRPSFFGFKAFQVISYALIMIFFLFALGNETAWKEIFQNPGLFSLSNLFLVMVGTLFSSKGLAALITSIVLNFYIGYRFFKRLRKRSRKAVEKTLKSLKGELLHIWLEKVDSVFSNLDNFKDDISAKVSAISILVDRKNQ